MIKTRDSQPTYPSKDMVPAGRAGWSSFAYAMAVVALLVILYSFRPPVPLGIHTVPTFVAVAGAEADERPTLVPPLKNTPSQDRAAFVTCVRTHILRPRPSDFQWRDGVFVTAPLIAVLGIFKNEAPNMREWIEHYVEQGIDYFLLLDNNSTDEYRQELEGFEDIVSVIPAPLKHGQEIMYNTLAVPWFKERGINLVLPVDFDEYAFSNIPEKTLADITWGIFNKSDSNMISSVNIPWSMFGSSGHDDQPRSVREGFTKRLAGIPYGGLGKSIGKLSGLTRLRIHGHDSDTGVRVDSPFTQMLGFQVNHYAIQSKKWFAATKMTRGDASYAELENKATWAYFERYDYKDSEDFLLKDQVKARRDKYPHCYKYSKFSSMKNI